MNMNQVNITRLYDSIKSLFATNYLPESTMNTFKYVGRLMGVIIQYPKEVLMKRLQKRKRFSCCAQKSKDDRRKCYCGKCTGHRTSQRKRVIQPDFFANLAYQHRITKDEKISRVKDAEVMKICYGDESNHRVTRSKKLADHRDVQISASTGWSWWTNVSCPRYMPPMHHPYRKPTKSECSSSISGYRSATPNAESLKESLKSCRNGSAVSIVTNNKSVVELAIINRNVNNRSKSDSRVVLRSDIKNQTKRLASSAFAKAPSLKKKKRSRRLFNVRRRKSKAKPKQKVSRQ